MDKIEIKELTLEDIPDYVKVDTLAWQESYKGLIADSILDEVANNVENSIQKQINKFDNDKKNNIKKFVFKVNNEAVGMTGIGKSTYEKDEDIGELYSLYLLNKVKKKGYGKMLFYHDVKELIGLGFNSMVIGCLVNNPANDFYKHMGGKLIEVVTKKIKGYNMTENIYYYENLKELIKK
jgi:N-acetylglutamate synthase-like GNAT family acetyltransferase